MTQMAAGRALSSREFALATGVPLRSVQRYLQRGLIPGAFRIGDGQWRIPRATVNEFVMEKPSHTIAV